MGSGSLACGVKEGIKLYVYSIRSAHVKKVQQRAMEVALTDALTDGLSSSAAAKQAQKIGDKAAKLARRKAKRIVGPILSSGWDFFEAVYYGGTLAEGVLRGTGTLFGTYIIGYHGEEAFGRFGYLVGSHLGSWIGGRIGLMCYDVVNGINFLVGFVETAEDTISEVSNDYAESSDDESVSESSDENPEASSEGWGFF